MMNNWVTFKDAMMVKVAEFAKLQPDTMKGFMAMDAGAAKSGHLDHKTHELIALAVSVTTRCDGCIATHTQKAIQNGATREEVAEALSVAISLNAGAAMTYSSRVLEAYDSFSK